MAVFNTNQNRQFYLVKRYADGTTVPAVGSANSVAGDLGVKVIADGLGKQLYFPYQGVDGAQRSDLIQLANLGYAKAIKADEMAIPMKKVEVTLDSNVNGGAPVSGQEYILRIEFINWCGAGDDTKYFKDIAVHATSAMSASDFYKALVKAANMSFSREVNANAESNPYLEFSVDNTTTATKFIIEEKPQPWTLGIESQERVYFNVFPTTVYIGGEDVIWGIVADATPTTVLDNGKQIADLEWFCMGERGDQYRMMGYPNYIATQYLVDPSQKYNVLELHYAFTDEGVSSYRSEKDITIAVPEGAAGSEYDVINDIIGAINTATGLSIATLA